MPGEVSLLNPSSWDETARNKSWKQKVAPNWTNGPEQKEANSRKVSISPQQNPWSLLALVHEDAIFMGLHTVVALVVIYNSRWCVAATKHKSESLKDKNVLNQGIIGSEVVISRIRVANVV